MAFGVFIHRSDSIYDDSPDERYQFPKQYLGRVEACVGDWIVYYEPTKFRGSRGYFAVARVQQVIPDPKTPEMYIAVIEPGSYLDFVNPVPFDGPAGKAELGLLGPDGRPSARAQWAVRPLSPTDFTRIVARGLGEAADLPRTGAPVTAPGFADESAPSAFDQDRERASFLASRVIRDRVFRSVVLRAYDSRCAVTGLRLINGGGRAEVEAAHIRPVTERGPDIVGNGLALSGTVHWMFDRGLITIADDHEILVSRQVNDPESVRGLINPTGRLLPPNRMGDHPHPHFMRWHRENCFKA